VDKSYTFDFGHTKGIKLNLVRDGAEIIIPMKTKKTVDEFTSFKVAPFKNAFEKTYILYLLYYGKTLDIESITIAAADRTEVFDRTNNDNFPFLFSMTTGKDISFNEKWKTIAEQYNRTTKTEISEDNRYVSMYSYILSRTREFEYDRFQNLWTSMNAAMNYFASRFEKEIKKKFDIKDGERLRNEFCIAGKDASSIGAMSFYLCGNYRKINPEIARSLWLEYINLERYLGRIELSDIDQFYEDLLELNSADEPSSMLQEKYDKLYSLAEPFEVSPYVLILIGYPYHWRCKYLHGNYIAPLFCAHNDDELRMLTVCNYFMDKFLTDEIPNMFSDDYWNEKKYDSVIRMLEKCEIEAYRKFIKGNVKKQ